MTSIRTFMAVVNRKYLNPLKSMWFSLFETNLYEICFYLFYEDLTAEDVQDLMTFISRWPDKHLVPVKMGMDCVEDLPVTDEFPKEIYYKLLGLDRISDDTDRVLCMDLDMIVKKDISHVFSVSMGAAGIAACGDVFGRYYGLDENNLAALGLSQTAPYFNAGFMLFYLPFIRQIGGGKAILRLASQYRKKLHYPEQDILNMVFHDNYLLLPWEIYNCPPLMYVMKQEEAESGNLSPLRLSEIFNGEIPDGYLDYTESIYENAAVIHYMGGTKPWKEDRKEMPFYGIFDRAYQSTSQSMNEAEEAVHH